jgi:hypothetical protein
VARTWLPSGSVIARHVMCWCRPTRGRAPLRSTRPHAAHAAVHVTRPVSLSCLGHRAQGHERKPWSKRRQHPRRQLTTATRDPDSSLPQALSVHFVLAPCFEPSPARPPDSQTTGRQWLAPLLRAPIRATTLPRIAASNLSLSDPYALLKPTWSCRPLLEVPLVPGRGPANGPRSLAT